MGDAIRQWVEKTSISDGLHTITWLGGGVGTINGVSVVSGDAINIVVGSDHVEVVIPTTATSAKLETGTIATPYIIRPESEDRLLCNRFSQNVLASLGFDASAGEIGYAGVQYELKRATPIISLLNVIDTTNVLTADFSLIQPYGARYVVTAGSDGFCGNALEYLIDAEIYSAGDP